MAYDGRSRRRCFKEARFVQTYDARISRHSFRGRLPGRRRQQAPPPPPTPAAPQAAAVKAVPRPIELRDILAWKTQGGSALSADGSWFGYRHVPLEGDGEVVFRQTKGDKEYRFPVGESRFGQLAISEDGKFAAFMISPEAKEARKLRQSRGRAYTKAAVLNLATGEKVEYDKIRAFQFAPENPGWILLHKAAPEGQEREKDKWTGSDLILRELQTGKELVLGNVAEFAFEKKGRWLALLIDAYGQTGNGVLLRRMSDGLIQTLDSDKATYKGLSWTEKGDGLACLKGKEDKAFEDKLYAAVGFTGFVPRTRPEDGLRPQGRQGLPGRDVDIPQPDAAMDRFPGCPDLRHPRAQEEGRGRRRRRRRRAGRSASRRSR